MIDSRGQLRTKISGLAILMRRLVHPGRKIRSRDRVRGVSTDTSGGDTNLYLVCYDYGMGGLWGYVRSSTEVEILTLYPELIVFAESTDYISAETKSRLRREPLDLSDSPSGLLKVVIAERSMK